VATYDVSGIFHLEVEAETEVDARRELARRLHVAGVQYYIMDSRKVEVNNSAPRPAEAFRDRD